jgi:predicted ATPase/class 3 adenylate cyclase/DNA-binding CsgD family transcriptional regulator
MSDTDPHLRMAPLNWSELGVSELLPTGTVTLLLADVEGSTRLWEADAEAMAAAIGRLNHAASDLIAVHHGVRPVEQGEGDSFVAAFARASDAVACALALQRAPLAPIRLRIGIHTGEVMLRDEGNYAGPTINRTARLRDLAHGGQTVLSAVVRDLVEDALPADVWLVDLGTHQLRDLPRPDPVTQLCHPDLKNDFPPLRSPNKVGTHGLPTHLTSFVGRVAQQSDIRCMLAASRLVTVSGAGGAGKTRLAVEVANRMTTEFADGVWYVDLAPITDPGVVPATVASALGAPENPTYSTTECVAQFIGRRAMLVVLDNCEHLLDATATIASTLLDACQAVTILATSREPLGLAGEATWRVPSLSLSDEALELFVDRARLVRPDFTLGPDNAESVAEICRRLDGMPLAIELAAARTRALSPSELLESLHDRFRLLTGGARTAMQRQQTLRASVDWSHALLTEPERVLFRRLAAFSGGFDLAAAQTVAGDDELERFQVLDQLTLLVDKSLLTVEDRRDGTRYLLPETVRQYALEKLGESGEAEAVRSRHRDHYTELAVALDAAADERRQVEQAERELDNLRAAFAWSREHGDTELALVLCSALLPLWQGRRVREGLAWLAVALADDTDGSRVGPAVRARALADEAVLDASMGDGGDFVRVEEALALARAVGDAELLSRVLAACLWTAGRNASMTQRYLPEALEVARTVGDPHRLTDVLARQAYAGFMIDGDPIPTRRAAEEGLAVADSIGDRANSRICRWCLATADWMDGDLTGAERRLEELVADCFAAQEVVSGHVYACTRSYLLSYLGDADAARAVANETLRCADALGEMFEGISQIALAIAALADGDHDAARAASAKAWQPAFRRETVAIYTVAEAALACGDLETAQTLIDEALSFMAGFHRKMALTVAARLAMAERRFDTAEQHLQEAVAICGRAKSVHWLAELFECLAQVAVAAESYPEAARLIGAATALRQRTKEIRFRVYDVAFDTAKRVLREALGDEQFERLHAEGFVLTPQDAIAYARRGRGERKRPASGWSALTPAERDVVRLLSEGLPNKEIATRLFISPRTVQSHLTHVYAKLGLTSRVQLAQESARHNDS